MRRITSAVISVFDLRDLIGFPGSDYSFGASIASMRKPV